MDATSLELFKTCPRKYYYSMILNRQSGEGNHHLDFGSAIHSAIELYHKEKALGKSHAESADSVLQFILQFGCTWDDEGVFHPWESGDPKGIKTRENLIRSTMWYLDNYERDSLSVHMVGGKTPAVELSFKLHTGIYSPTGEEFILCGHLDAVVEANGQLWILDHKTTTRISEQFFDGFTPHLLS